MMKESIHKLSFVYQYEIHTSAHTSQHFLELRELTPQKGFSLLTENVLLEEGWPMGVFLLMLSQVFLIFYLCLSHI